MNHRELASNWQLVASICSLSLVACASAPSSVPEKAGPAILVTEEMGHPHVGDPAPDFEVQTPEGERVRLSELRGKVVALSFATSWCPFSKAEQPALARLAKDYGGTDDVHVLIVNIDESVDGYRKFTERVPMNAPVYWTPQAETVLSYVPPRAIPTITRKRWRVLVTANLVIDKQGTIRMFLLTDTRNFDAELRYIREAVEAARTEQGT